MAMKGRGFGLKAGECLKFQCLPQYPSWQLCLPPQRRAAGYTDCNNDDGDDEDDDDGDDDGGDGDDQHHFNVVDKLFDRYPISTDLENGQRIWIPDNIRID